MGIYSGTPFDPLLPTTSFPQSGGMNFNDPAGSYNRSFANAAQINQGLFRDIQAAHAQRIAQAQQAQQALQQGYASLTRRTQRMLAGSNRANIQDINDKYTALSGGVQAQLIARGLGNTSILGNLARGVASDRAQEVTRSQGQFAQLRAGSLSNIGLAGLAARMQGIGMLSGLQGDQISSLERVSAPYPDPGMFAQLAMARGGGGMSGMPGLPGPAPALGPIGGWQPPIPRGGVDLSGGGGLGGGFEWATGGYAAPAGGWNAGLLGTYDGGGGIIGALASAGGGFANLGSSLGNAGMLGDFGMGGDF